MKLIQNFKDFLDKEVNLNPTRLNTLDERVTAITNFLKESETFNSNYIDVIPQGSFAHKTIIKPVREKDEFDADVLLYLEEFEDWEAEDYVEELYQCFRNSGIYKEKAIRGKRCVTIDYAEDFHVDVVPYLERSEKKYITYRPDNEFEVTDPEAYNTWLEEKNATANRHLVKVIRLIKYLRDYKGTFKVKSVVLNVLLGNQVSDIALLEDPGCYADVPTTLKTVMNRLSAYVDGNTILPTIIDPSGTGENLSDRWNQEEYDSFGDTIIRYAEWIEDAWLDQDAPSSRKKWQRVFGDQFGTPNKALASEAVKSQNGLLPPFTDTEEQIEGLGFTRAINPRHLFRIRGRVQKSGSMGAYYLGSRGNRVLPNRAIKFEVEVCNVPQPYRIFWKVLNRGPEAIKHNSIRGQIEEGGRIWKRWEPTAFGGSHYVECYIVKDGSVVATHRQPVNISHFF